MILGSGEESENMKSLGQQRRQWQWNRKKKSTKWPTCALGAGELKNDGCSINNVTYQIP